MRELFEYFHPELSIQLDKQADILGVSNHIYPMYAYDSWSKNAYLHFMLQPEIEFF